MPMIMTKYKYQDKTYLVYNKNILDREFTANEWSIICDNDLGIGVDFVVEITNTQIMAYNAQGRKITLTDDMKNIVDYYERKITNIEELSRTIEVRFTDNYIKKVISSVDITSASYSCLLYTSPSPRD